MPITKKEYPSKTYGAINKNVVPLQTIIEDVMLVLAKKKKKDYRDLLRQNDVVNMMLLGVE